MATCKFTTTVSKILQDSLSWQFYGIYIVGHWGILMIDYLQ